MLRYVDDYVGPEHSKNLKHSLSCFARLTRILLGADSIADAKMEYGKNIRVLGVDLVIKRKGFTCRPSVEKVCPHALVRCLSTLCTLACRQSDGPASSKIFCMKNVCILVSAPS